MSFLSDYIEFTKGSEAHPTYHTFSGLVALSSIISRRVWIEQGYFKVFPNLYVVLVGPPGNRKTSAMSIAKSLIRELKDIPFSAECVTKEKLVEDFALQERIITGLPAGHPQQIYTPMTVMVTELSEFLGAGSTGMINFLVTVYDQDFYELRTKNKGTSLITGPFLNVLACTTPDWVTTYLRSDVISGGFSRRAIFVLETGKSGRITFPEVTLAAKAAWARTISYAVRLQSVHGKFEWDPEAKAFYHEWYQTLKMPMDETISGYYESKHIQLLKISMLIAVSESPTLILKKSHILFGLELLKLAEENLARVFQGIGRNELNAAATKVLDMVSAAPEQEFTIAEGAGTKKIKAPVIPEKRLRGLMFRLVDAREMDGVLQHLIDTDKIGRLTTQATTTSVARTIIYLKSK